MPTSSPLQVDQRAAGIARIDRGVGLDEVLVAQPAQAAAADRRDDARGHRLAEAERIADRDHEIADAQRAGIGQRQRGAGSSAGIRISATSVSGSEPTNSASNVRPSASVTDTSSAPSITWWLVSTRPRCGVDDHARAQRLVDPLLRQLREHAAEIGSSANGLRTRTALLGVHVDHRRRDPLPASAPATAAARRRRRPAARPRGHGGSGRRRRRPRPAARRASRIGGRRRSRRRRRRRSGGERQEAERAHESDCPGRMWSQAIGQDRGRQRDSSSAAGAERRESRPSRINSPAAGRKRLPSAFLASAERHLMSANPCVASPLTVRWPGVVSPSGRHNM